MADFFKLTIKEITRETPEAISVVFNIPQELQSNYQYTPGQYINLKLTLDGQEIRRAYSICSSPNSGELRIAIKAIKNGFFSTFANKQLAVGNLIEVSTPEGRFTLKPDANHTKNYAAFVAGSGITPVMAMIQAVMEEEPNSNFVLIYGNRTPENTIFYNRIKSLQEKFLGRFFVHYVFSQTDVDGALFGRIDKSVVNYIIKNKHNEFTFDKFFICGPNQMITTVSDTLKENNFKEDQIKFELFTSDITENKVDVAASGEVKVTVLLDDEETSFNVPSGATLLDAALKNGVDAPYSCQGGICSSCLCRIVSGSATMKKNAILTDQEISEGLILSCQAIPTSAEIYIDYDNI